MDIVKITIIILFSFLVTCGFCANDEKKPGSPKKVIFRKVDFETDKELLSMTVTLRNDTNGNIVADVDAELFQDLDTTLFINNVISKRLTKTDYQPVVRSGRLNLCEFFKNPDKQPFLKTFLNALKSYGDLMFSCPMRKGKYNLRNFEMNAEFLPSFTPLGDYTVDFSILRKADNGNVEQLYRMVWYAAVTV